MPVLYDSKGNKQESEASIEISELPKGDREFISKNYKIKTRPLFTKSTGEVIYEAGIKIIDILFKKDGKFIKMKEIKAVFFLNGFFREIIPFF